MGAVYSVKLRLYYQDPNLLISAIQDFVNGTHDADFNSVDYSSVPSAIQAVLPKRGFYVEQQLDDYIACSCDFDASYSWENILYDWYDSIAPVLDDGSKIWIFPDNDFIEGVVQNGSVRWSEYPDKDYEEPDMGSANVGMQVDDPELQQAIDYINEFSEDEYGDIGIEAGDDLHNVGLMYSTAGDEDEYEVEVSADLVNYTISYYVNGEMVDQDKYSSIEDMNDTLQGLNFDWLYSACCEHIDFDEDE